MTATLGMVPALAAVMTSAMVSGTAYAGSIELSELDLSSHVVFANMAMEASSEPVSIRDMVKGWDGSVESGRYAWADARLQAGIAAVDQFGSRWMIGWQKRWHYDLTFSDGMVRYYDALENGTALSGTESLKLKARTLQAEGPMASWRFSLLENRLMLTPTVSLYQVSQWQFGELNGLASSGDTESASAVLDYQFNEDKILEYQPDDSPGYGVSLDVNARWQLRPTTVLDLAVADLWNLFRTESSGYTSACVNFNDPAETVCESDVTASGKSGDKVFYGRLRPTITASLSESEYQARLTLLSHGDYLRVGVEKDFQLNEHWRLTTAGYSSRQLGLGVASDWFSLAVKSDDLRAASARDASVNVSINIPLGF